MADDTRTFTWTLELQDKFTKPMKTVQNQWNKTTQAGVRRSKQMKRSITELSTGLKKFAKNLKDSVTQLSSFSKAAVAVISVVGVGALVAGLWGAFKRLLMVGIELEEQTLQLVTVTDASAKSMGFLAAEARTLSLVLGQSYDKSIQMIKAIQDIRPTVAGAEESFHEFMQVVVDYSTATDSSVESTAALFHNLELLGAAPHDIRRLGDSMKYWADRTKLTNAEIQNIVKSTESLTRFITGKERRVAATAGLTGISAIFADTLLGDPQQLLQAFTTLSDVLEQSPLHGFVSQMLPGGRAALKEAMVTGDYVSVFEALIRASKKARADFGGLPGLKALRGEVERTTGLSAEVIASLSELEPGGIQGLIQQAAASKAVEKANAKRRDSMLRNWEEIKQKFLKLIARVSKPLMTFIDTIMDPLFNFFTKLTTAAENFFIIMDKNKDMPFMERFKLAAKEFWKDIGGPELMDEIWAGIKSWILENRIGEWIGENILYPAFSTVFSERVAKRILRKPVAEVAAPPTLAESLRERVGEIPGGADIAAVEKSLELRELEQQILKNIDATLAGLKTAFGPEGYAVGMTKKEFHTEFLRRGGIAGLDAIDKAYETALTYDLGQEMFPPSNEIVEGS